MDTEKRKSIVDALNDKAVAASDSGDAMRFTQAATNAANSYCALAAALTAKGS